MLDGRTIDGSRFLPLTGAPIATSGTTISPQFGTADYNVQVAGCSASAVVAVTCRQAGKVSALATSE